MKRFFVNAIFFLAVNTIEADWSIETIHEPPADHEHYYAYYFLRGTDAIHFTGANPGPMRAYKLDLNSLKVTDSIILKNSAMEGGSISTSTITLSDGMLYVEKYMDKDSLVLFRWDASTYKGVEDIGGHVQNSLRDMGVDDVYGFLGESVLNGNTYRVYAGYPSGDIFYTSNDIEFESGVAFGGKDLDIEGKTFGHPRTINDSLIFIYTSSPGEHIRSSAIIKRPEGSKWYSEVIKVRREFYDYRPLKHLLTDRYIYTKQRDEGSGRTRIIKYDPIDDTVLAYHNYPDEYSTVTRSGSGDYLISLFDGRIYDSGISTDSPVFTLDTSMIRPRGVEKLGNGEYLVFSPEGIFRLIQNTSIDDEQPLTAPSLPTAIIDLTGRIIYIGDDAESKLSSLARGTYIVMVDGKGELRRVE